MPIYEYKGQHYEIESDDPAVAKNKIISHLNRQANRETVNTIKSGVENIGQGAASLADQLLGAPAALLGHAAYGASRALGSSPERATEIAQAVQPEWATNPLGTAAGVTNTPGYQNELSRRVISGLGENVISPIAGGVANATGLPNADVENMANSLIMGFGPKALGKTIETAAIVPKTIGDINAGLKYARYGDEYQGTTPFVKNAFTRLAPDVESAETMLQSAIKNKTVTPEQAAEIRRADYMIPRQGMATQAATQRWAETPGIKKYALPGGLATDLLLNVTGVPTGGLPSMLGGLIGGKGAYDILRASRNPTGIEALNTEFPLPGRTQAFTNPKTGTGVAVMPGENPTIPANELTSVLERIQQLPASQSAQSTPHWTQNIAPAPTNIPVAPGAVEPKPISPLQLGYDPNVTSAIKPVVNTEPFYVAPEGSTGTNLSAVTNDMLAKRYPITPVTPEALALQTVERGGVPAPGTVAAVEKQARQQITPKISEAGQKILDQIRARDLKKSVTESPVTPTTEPLATTKTETPATGIQALGEIKTDADKLAEIRNRLQKEEPLFTDENSQPFMTEAERAEMQKTARRAERESGRGLNAGEGPGAYTMINVMRLRNIADKTTNKANATAARRFADQIEQSIVKYGEGVEPPKD
jgi:hypothetical protein